MAILVTGGTGFIGSHTVVELLNRNKEVVIADNLCNSKEEVLNRIYQITGKRVKFYKVDLRNYADSRKIFEENEIDSIIHFAGLKSVGESVKYPELYFDNNLGSTNTILKLMKEFGVKNLVFSSSATVYGVPKHVPMVETDEIGGCTNPYGQTKYEIERILQREYKEDPSFNFAILRYFNPIGAHPSGLIGEDPNGIPNNLMPYITQVACGKLPQVNVFGDDYDTPDGTGVRDYIHVCDLAIGHLYALKKLEEKPGLVIYNLGTGHGVSVLELIHAFEKANNLKIPYVIKERRPGDIATSFADASKAYREMGWKTEKDIVDCCKDSWNWQSHNPKGYDE